LERKRAAEQAIRRAKIWFELEEGIVITPEEYDEWYS
jgi:hypothetical protein